MRIFLSCQQALKLHPVPAYGYWKYYFKSALEEAGHEIIEAADVDWAEGLTQLSNLDRAAWLERSWTNTLESVRRENRTRHIDLFLGYFFPYQVEPSAVRSIRELGIPCVNFFCDNVREFTRVPLSFRDFDLHWVPEAEARIFYKKADLPFIYAPMPMWVRPELRNVSTKENGGVIFVGSHDELREDLLGEAAEFGSPVNIYGAGWSSFGAGAPTPARTFSQFVANQIVFMRHEGLRGLAMRATYKYRKARSNQWLAQHLHPSLSGDDYFKALRESTVVIGINRYPSFRRPFSNPHKYSRLRDIEAPMLGSCLLTEMAPGLDDLYEIGSEIEAFNNATELVEISNRLRHDSRKRLSLRQLGQRRALSEHTVARSVERIIERLGILK